ncbi:hypothetical protein NUACC21_79940 [Scytonema sp. NUACC21]
MYFAVENNKDFTVNDYQPDDCWLPTKSIGLGIIPDNFSDDKKLHNPLKPLLNTIKKFDEELTRSQREYIKSVDLYLNQNKPFSTPIEKSVPANKKDRLEKLAPVITQYQKLVRYCLPTENSYIIRKWGINYPLKYFCISDKTSNKQEKSVFLGGYVDELVEKIQLFTQPNFLIENKIPLQVKPYFVYLVDELPKYVKA